MRSIAHNADAIARSLKTMGAKAPVKAAAITRHHGALLVTAIKGEASGRPGPNAPSGDYNRSWNGRFRMEGTDAVYVAGTNRPQGLRLELGFVGADSLGRHYKQEPYPHAGPGLQKIEPAYLASLAAGVIQDF